MKNRLPLKFLGATLLIALFWFSIMFMYIDDLMSDDQKDDKVKDTSDIITKEIGGAKLGLHEKIKKSRFKRLRADKRRRHRKLVSTTTVSDFELYNDDDFSRYVEISDGKQGKMVKPEESDGHTADKTVSLNPAGLDVGNASVSLMNNDQSPGHKKRDENKTSRKTNKTIIRGKGKMKGKGRKDSEASIVQKKLQTDGLVKNISSVISKVRDITREQTHNFRKKLAAERRAQKSQSTVQNTNPKPAYYNDGLTRDQLLDQKESFKRHSFNVTASDGELVDRFIPDTRPQECLLDHDVLEGRRLPAASVIICFHNEAWSTLLRTVHSVLNRSPDELIQEIILVDDFSSYDYLGGKLEAYVTLLPKVQLVRTTKREGLVRARILGMSYAQADTLVFLDSHCECNENWLPPLLQHIVDDPRKILCPELDIIDPQTFEYKAGPIGMNGGFDWLLQFTWKPAPNYHGDTDRAQPIRTPVMIGGIFAVNKKFFTDFGGFDAGMEIWGGENLELSFRTWSCGGSICIMPCSRVGHVFRSMIPYTFPDGAAVTVRHNAARVAEMWLGHYKYIYYATQENPRDPSVASAVSERLELHERLGCKSFDWYLNTVMPEMQIPPVSAQYYGNLEQSGTHTCVSTEESSQNPTEQPQQRHLALNDCDKFTPKQMFGLMSDGELRHNTSCVSMTTQQELVLTSCDRNTHHWNYNSKTGQLSIHTTTSNQHSSSTNADNPSSLCLTLSQSKSDVISLSLTPCETSRVTASSQHAAQTWNFTYHFNVNVLQYVDANYDQH